MRATRGDLDVRIVGTERDPESGIVGYPTVVATCEGVRDGIAPLLRDGAFPVVLGGCCTLVPGVAAALRTVDPRPAGMAYSTAISTSTTAARAPRARRPTCRSRSSPVMATRRSSASGRTCR